MTNIQPPMEHFERPDPVLTNKIVTHLKSQGIFDQFRRECMADVDTKPAYHNLRQRVEGSVAAFLRMNPWRPDMNKNQLRDNLRKHIQSGGFLDIGVDRIVDQVVNPKIYTVFLPKVEEVVQSCLGMENDKPKFEPPPPTEVKSEPPKFQDKHNLAPRAKLPAPLMGPTVTPLKPQDQVEGRSSPAGEKLVDGGDTDTEEAGDKKYVVDEDDLEEKEEDEDDEESPPFEPHSEGDRLILGMRSDSSENSNDSQVVTTIVDDSLEERIDNNEEAVKEESDKKDDDSSSDEYVPKTPTINMEESDGTVLEFNSISEYKQYQSKFEEESLGNIEEVVESQCTNDNNELVKEERSSNEEDFMSGAQKRKFNSDSYDDVSSSSSDRESTSDEIKPAVFESFTKKRLKLEEYDHDNETSELSINDADVEDYYTDKSLDITDSKLKILGNEHPEKPKHDSSKDSGKNCKEHRESSSYHSSKERTAEKEHHERSQSSHSSKEKKDVHKKSEKHESSRDQNKERDRKRSESSSKHNEKDGKSKHYEKEKDKDKKRSKSSERPKKDREDVDKNRKESKHDHKDHHHEGKSRADHDKEKKKHTSHDRHSDGKGGHDAAHKSDKDRRDSSKHGHSSSRHSHRSSSEKHKSDKDHKHRGSSDRHKSHDKKIDKETKDESKKRYREHCKYNTDKDENRRSSDRDSSGPSERTHISSSSKSKSSRTLRETKIETSGKTTSNSDNTVSDNIEPLDDVSKSYAVSEHGKTSPDLQLEDSQNDWNCSKEELDQLTVKPENINKHSYKQTQEGEVKYRDDIEDNYETRDSSDFQTQALITENYIDSESNVFSPGNAKEVYCGTKQDSTSPSPLLHDSSSEKENIEQDIKEQSTPELDGSSTDASIDEDSTVVKFKKPKIAKNIHEVKKIMEARRHLKRMEKKRIKLLLKSNSEEYESDEKSPVENKSEDKSQCDSFTGFEDDLSPEKVKKYECLTIRLENEASQLEKLINFEQLNTNLITSWVDLDPDFDDYIENTLKGKVHRKYRIHLPPICDEYYTYDSEQNVYFLVQDWDATEQKDVLVDSNLNNLSNQQENRTLYSAKSRKRKLKEEPISCDNRETLHEGCVFPKQSSLKHKQNHRNSQYDDEVITITDDNVTTSNSDSRNTIESQIVLTFNQTYDEVLKEKAQNSFVSSKREVEEKTPFTVVKITNNQTSEQVFMKKIQSNSEEVPRITRSETILNGKITEKTSDSKQVPLISRITKAKIASVPSTMRNNRKQANGILTSDSTINSKYEENFPVGVSQKIINDVIGIQYVSSDQGNVSDQSNQSGEEVSDRKRMRMTGCRQQRYDSSDLYKPRPQLTSRRVRAVGSSPEEPSAPLVVSRRKRSATSDSNSTRRR